jgi:hypothetical protein
MTSSNPYAKYKLMDKGGRRSGGDRRKFTYSFHLPERRENTDRRKANDRRRFPRYRVSSE